MEHLLNRLPEKWEEKDILNVIKVITDFHQRIEPSKFETVKEFQPWKSVELYKKRMVLHFL